LYGIALEGDICVFRKSEGRGKKGGLITPGIAIAEMFVVLAPYVVVFKNPHLLGVFDNIFCRFPQVLNFFSPCPQAYAIKRFFFVD